MNYVMIKTEEPSETITRLAPLAHAFALANNGGFDKVTIWEPETNVILYTKSAV